MKNASVYWTLIGFSLLYLPLNAQLDTFALSQQLAEKFSAADLPGMAVAVVGADQIYSQRTFGYANVEEEQAFSPQSCMPVGSVTKTLTGFAVVQLIEEGLLKWDAPINSYLPFTIDNPYSPESPILLYQLLNHTSSLQDGKNYGQTYLLDDHFDLSQTTGTHEGYLNFLRSHEARSMEEFVRETLTPKGSMYKKKNFLKAGPGKEQSYSNINATVAGLIVQQVSGKSFTTYAEEAIFEPLGMAASSWSGEKSDCAARLYFPSGYWVPPYKLATYPDGGWTTNLSDLSRFLGDVLTGFTGQGGILTADSYRNLLPGDEDDRRAFWGMGTTRVIGHSGSDPGVHCELRFSADHPVGIILMTNVNVEDSEALWEQYRSIRKVLETAAASIEL